MSDHTKYNFHTGVVDEPVAEASGDALDIKVHAAALTRYILQTRTPITVGVQGEWGSGKTSLINTIHQNLSDTQSVKQIWINAWEHSLLCSPEETLLKIVSLLVQELLACDPDISKSDTIKKSISTIFKGAVRASAFAVGGVGAEQVAKELVEGKQAGIGDLKAHLEELLGQIASRSTNPVNRIVVYVDDLDRVEPVNAVKILELLKNIFSLPNCIFVLAIDYQVVVKGLEGKFGKQTDANEWEFRAFFDKIIQLPFMMPMGQYNIGKYVNSLLREVGFIESNSFDEAAIKEIVMRTVGGNPRSIKRLINSISLIKIFSEEKLREGAAPDGQTEIQHNQRQLLIFAIVCLQIAYPYLYTVLTSHPDFMSWDDTLALKETKKAEENSPNFRKEFEAATAQGSDFDEEWEQVLYKLCYLKPRLKPRASDISKFFSYIRDQIIGEKFSSQIGEVIASVLSETSVTNVTSTDSQQVSYPATEKYKATRFDTWEQYRVFLQTERGRSSAILDKTAEIIGHIQQLIGHECEINYTMNRIAFRKAHAVGRKKEFLALNIGAKKIFFRVSSGYDEHMNAFAEGKVDNWENFELPVFVETEIEKYDPLVRKSYDFLD